MTMPAVEAPATEVDPSTLSDEQIKQELSGQPAPEPAPEPAKVTPEPTPPAATEPAAPATPPEPAADTMYAGKYKTADELYKGLIEIGKPLGYNQKFLERMIDLAKKTGDLSSVEQTYKDLFDDLSKNRKTEAPKEPAAATPEKDTPLADTQAERETQEFQVVVDETYRSLENHPLVAEMQAAGAQMPKTKAEFDQMKIDFPYLAMQFGSLFSSTFSNLKKEVGEYVKAQGEVESHNTTFKESEKQHIKETLKDLKLEGISDADIDKAVEDALKSDNIYEDRHGVKFIRDGGILEHFLAKDFRRLANLIKTNGEIEGRTQHAEDLQAMKNKGLRSISTVPLPGARRKDPAPIDVDDDAQVASLSDDAIEKHLKGVKPLT